MPIHCNYTCKKCGEEIECEVVINEECDLPEACPACGAPIPDEAHGEMEEQACEQASERPDYD